MKRGACWFGCMASFRGCACYPHGDGGPRATPSAAFWQEILHRRTPCAHQAKSCTQHVRRQYRLLTCLPILPLISPPGSSVVTSPRAPRQFPFACDCLGRSSWGRPGRPPKTRPARVPPSPPPCRCPLSIYRQVPSTPVYFPPPCTSFPAHTPLPIASSLINLTRLGSQLSSSSAQLSSARARTSAACSSCVGGTARQDRQ